MDILKNENSTKIHTVSNDALNLQLHPVGNNSQMVAYISSNQLVSVSCQSLIPPGPSQSPLWTKTSLLLFPRFPESPQNPRDT